MGQALGWVLLIALAVATALYARAAARRRRRRQESARRRARTLAAHYGDAALAQATEQLHGATSRRERAYRLAVMQALSGPPAVPAGLRHALPRLSRGDLYFLCTAGLAAAAAVVMMLQG
jgi:hypothetical protein